MNTSRNAMVFVYGVLRKGFGGHRILRGLHARFKGNGSVQGQLYDLGDYPGAVKVGRDAGYVHGELYEFPNCGHALTLLDRFEGARASNPKSGLFRRETTTVTLANGEQMLAWIYWLGRAHQPRRRLPSGRYDKA